MHEPRNINEAIFDHRFREKPKIDYSKLPLRPGWRDRKVLRLLMEHGIAGRRCLDVGPGTGRWLQFLKDHGAAGLAAVDISQEALDRVAALGADCRKADVEYEPLEFPDDSFDITLAFMVLEHLKSPDLFIREVVRVTRPAGLVLLTIPNIASFQSRVRLLLGYLPVAVAQDSTHVGFYTVRELKALFRSNGAEIEVVPTAFSLHPSDRRRMQIPTNRLLAGLDDNRLIRVRVDS